METIDIYPNSLKDSIVQIQQAASIIKASGTVVFPTDTVYGLGANALDEFAIGRIFTIKKRPKQKPLPILVSNIEMAKKYTCIDSKVEQALNQLWPGPITCILRKKDNLPNILTSGKNTIGIRVPDNKIALELIKKIGQPITGTSANISKAKECHSSEEVIKQFKDQFHKPDLILDAGQIEKSSRPSTIIDLTTPKPKILRIGPVTKKELTQILKS